MNLKAYWINPKGKVFQLNGGFHINYIIDNPSKFGETKKSIKDTYDDHNERLPHEGKAREEIIKRVLKQGFIRIREYTNRWSIQLNKLTQKYDDYIWAWSKSITPMDKYSDVSIHELYNDKITKTSFNKISEVVIMEELVDKYMIKESSLSRLWKHNLTHDCSALTAFRKYHNCGYDDDEPCDNETPIELTKRDNKKRNLALASDLKKLGYGVTKVIGNYPEGGRVVKEVSFFVVNIKNDKSFVNDIKRLGEKYNQDSVLIIPKGAIDGDDKAYLIGTNHCCNNWLGYNKKEVFNKGKIGYDSPIYTTYVNDRPFIFESFDLTDTLFGSGSNSIMASKFSERYGKL